MNFLKFFFIVLGIFLLSFATNAYVLFGPLGKYSSLFLGFFLIWYGVPKFLNFIYTLNFSFFSLIYFSLLMIFEILGNHEISILNFVFFIICFLLFLCGFCLSKIDLKLIKYNRLNFFCIIPFLTIVGSVSLLLYQYSLINDESLTYRGYGDESDLNAVGVSFVSGLIFIINYSVFISLNLRSKFVKFIFVSALISSLAVMISTLSRGSILFLIVLSLIYLYNLRKSINYSIFNFISIFTGIILLFTIFFNFIPFLKFRMESIFNRFYSLMEFSKDASSDLSSLERTNYYTFFLKNWDQ
ncbi:hypothetical protein D0X99_20225, partial [Algoriphagus lacus]